MASLPASRIICIPIASRFTDEIKNDKKRTAVNGTCIYVSGVSGRFLSVSGGFPVFSANVFILSYQIIKIIDCYKNKTKYCFLPVSRVWE